jgi:DNA-binding Xre family transcriptional regulator
MYLSYKKLWKMLIDKNMTKMELKDAAGISAASIAKLGKGGNITTDVLLKICKTLNCHVEDILETIDE